MKRYSARFTFIARIWIWRNKSTWPYFVRSHLDYLLIKNRDENDSANLNLRRKKSKSRKKHDVLNISKIKPWERYKLRLHKDGGLNNLIDQCDLLPFEDQELDLGFEYKVDFDECEFEDSDLNEESRIELEEDKELDLQKVILTVA